MISGRADTGSATVELAVLTPVFIMMLALVVLVGRVGASRADVQGVAAAAARSISLSRSPTEATALARADAQSSLRVGSATCRSMGWSADVTATEITVTISCQVDLAGAAILPVPATYTVRAAATEVRDRFVEVTP